MSNSYDNLKRDLIDSQTYKITITLTALEYQIAGKEFERGADPSPDNPEGFGYTPETIKANTTRN